MIDIISIIGTRPETIRVIKKLPNHMIVNTGQHYDENMDVVFWKERGIEPDMNLGAKSFEEIYTKVCNLIDEHSPKLIITYGDTRSSFVAALVAKSKGVKVAHLEAGVRCYDMDMPEERNRIMIDSIADYLFAVNERCKENLLKENVQGKIFVVGDIVFDNYIEKRKHKDFVLMTIHRKQNQNYIFIQKLLNQYSKEKKIIFPIHPVMKKFIGVKIPKNLEIIDPVGHNEMLQLIKEAKLVVTDSGGVQREAFFMGVPLDVKLKKNPWDSEINVFGNGHAEEKIKTIILEELYGRRENQD